MGWVVNNMQVSSEESLVAKLQSGRVAATMLSPQVLECSLPSMAANIYFEGMELE